MNQLKLPFLTHPLNRTSKKMETYDAKHDGRGQFSTSFLCRLFTVVDGVVRYTSIHPKGHPHDAFGAIFWISSRYQVHPTILAKYTKERIPSLGRVINRAKLSRGSILSVF